MKEIPLTRGFVALVDDGDYESVSQWKWCAQDHGRTTYAVRSVRDFPGAKRRRIYLHRFLMNAADNQEIDHANGDGLDNTRSNLRLCTTTENKWNRRKFTPTTSKYKGVMFRRNRWVATTKIARRQIHLGCFLTEIEAANAYDQFAVEHYGPFARLNVASVEQASPLIQG